MKNDKKSKRTVNPNRSVLVRVLFLMGICGLVFFTPLFF